MIAWNVIANVLSFYIHTCASEVFQMLKLQVPGLDIVF